MQKIVTIFQFTCSDYSRILQKPNKSHTNRIIQIVPCKTAIKVLALCALEKFYLTILKGKGSGYIAMLKASGSNNGFCLVIAKVVQSGTETKMTV